MRKIPLRRLVNRKRTVVAYALVDDEDYARISVMRWHLTELGYAMTNVPKANGSGYRRVFMHRLLNNTGDDLWTDHINGNRLDNRRSNLRSVEPWQNAVNTCVYKNNPSGRKGVTWDRHSGKWRARIQVNRRQMNLGVFDTIEAAANAYSAAAKIYHAEFARV